MTHNLVDHALFMAIPCMPIIASISDDDASAFCIAASLMLAIYAMVELWNFLTNGTKARNFSLAAKIFFSIFALIFACIAFCVVTISRWLVKDHDDE